MKPVEVKRSDSPLILAFPHVGTHVPPAIWERLDKNGHLLADTDWHVDRLYDDLDPVDAKFRKTLHREGLKRDPTTVRATFHRYVIDANRDPSGNSLYPGQNTTGLVPLTDFDGYPIWRIGMEPTGADIAARVAEFHVPYHAALAAEIAEAKRRYGWVIVYDCHSIRSEIPFLFPGKLPDFNIGTDHGRTCSEQIERIAVEGTQDARGFTSVLNGRFRGGWTTRHYGRPTEDVHAIQMELAQSTYLATEEHPFRYDAEKAALIRKHLAELLHRIEMVMLDVHENNEWWKT